MRTSREPWYRKDRQRWYVEINGKQVCLGKDKAEAKRKWHKLMHEGVPKAPYFHELMQPYLATLKGENFRKRTSALAEFADHVGRIRVSKLTEDHVATFLRANWSGSTARTYIVSVLACLNYAVKTRVIPQNPLRDVTKPPWERREAVMTKEERETVLAHVRGPFRDLVIALSETGCRPGEIYHLQIEQCDLDHGLWVVKNKTRGQTGIRKRTVYLTDGIVELTRRLIGERTTGNVFRNSRGVPWGDRAAGLRFLVLRKRLGLSKGVTAYSLRHRFISDAINDKKMDSLIVATLVGHTNASMLQKHYFHPDPESMREAAKKARGEA
jgi:integrase/recombinase XerC